MSIKMGFELVKSDVAEGAGNTYSATNHPIVLGKGVAAMQSSDEQWRPVAGFEGRYEVSDQGRVRSLDGFVEHRNGFRRFKPGRVLAQVAQPNGYLRVTITRGTREYVHRLVLAAFVGPCPPSFVACHANDVKTDNRLENLRWDSHSANRNDSVVNGKHPMANKTHCVNGHEFTPERVRVGNRTRRFCRQCEIDRAPAKNAKRRADRAHRRAS